MSHFAKVAHSKVQQVIVAEQDFIESFQDPAPGVWIQTSYNTRGNVHYGADGKPDGGKALRGNYAGIGYIYDYVHDVFYPPQPYNSWTIGPETNWVWQAPVPKNEDGKAYVWNEAVTNWVEVPIPQ